MPQAVRAIVYVRHELSGRDVRPTVLIHVAYNVGYPDWMASELNHLVLCLRLHVLCIAMSIFKWSPSPAQLSHKAADIRICCMYTAGFIFRSSISKLPFIHTSSTSLVLHVNHHLHLVHSMRAKWEMAYRRKKTVCKEVTILEGSTWNYMANYVPVGWCPYSQKKKMHIFTKEEK